MSYYFSISVLYYYNPRSENRVLIIDLLLFQNSIESDFNLPRWWNLLIYWLIDCLIDWLLVFESPFQHILLFLQYSLVEVTKPKCPTTDNTSQIRLESNAPATCSIRTSIRLTHTQVQCQQWRIQGRKGFWMLEPPFNEQCLMGSHPFNMDAGIDPWDRLAKPDDGLMRSTKWRDRLA